MLQNLKHQFELGNWKEMVSAAEQLGELGSEDALSFLTEKLRSSDSSTSNAAALGLRTAKDQKYFPNLLTRILELGCEENIGTLVYALEVFECSKNLFEICYLFLNGSYEVKSSVTLIINEQVFQLTKKEYKKIDDLLISHGYSLNTFDIKYELIET